MSSPQHTRSRRCLDYCLEHPGAKLPEIMAETGVSKNTAIKWRKVAQEQREAQAAPPQEEEAQSAPADAPADFDETFPAKPPKEQREDEETKKAKKAAAFNRRDARYIEHRW